MAWAQVIILSEETEKRNEDQSEATREAMANEKKQALAMRDRALERLGERGMKRRRRKKSKPLLNKGGETLEWLRERAAVDTEMKEQEMKEKREERETKKLHKRNGGEATTTE